MACWYCSVRPAEANHMLETNLFGDLDAHKSYDQTKVAYSVRHVGIPRCGDCHRRHRQAKGAYFFAGLTALSLLGAATAVGLSWLEPLYSGLWAGFSAGLLLGAGLAGRMVQSGIHTVRASLRHYPEIADLRERGYRFGLRPRKARPKPPTPPVTPAPYQVPVQPSQPPYEEGE